MTNLNGLDFGAPQPDNVLSKNMKFTRLDIIDTECFFKN